MTDRQADLTKLKQKITMINKILAHFTYLLLVKVTHLAQIFYSVVVVILNQEELKH